MSLLTLPAVPAAAARFGGAPSNDNYFQAVPLTGPSGTVTGTTDSATKQVNEVNHAGQAGGASVWYRIDSTAPASVTIDTTGSAFNTVLAVYTITYLDNSEQFDLVAANNDSGGPQSSVSFATSDDEQYLIAVDGVGGASGPVTLNYSIGAAVALDGVVAISGLGSMTCALLQDTTAACWGEGYPLPHTRAPRIVHDDTGAPLTGITQIVPGSSHICAVLQDETLQCWGDNTIGQLGDGTLIDRLTPAPVEVSNGVPLTGVAEVSLGSFTTCARLTNGQARCWGQNNGALGDGTQVHRRRPVTVVNSAGTGPLVGVAEIDVGADTCARLANGTVRCSDRFDGSTTPLRLVAIRPVSGPGSLTGVTQLAVGSGHVCARLANGQARCIGRNSLGELGFGVVTTSREPPVSRPKAVLAVAGAANLTGVTTVGLGSGLSCARLSTGQVRCWGWNGTGAVGDGTVASPRTRPRIVRNVGNTAALTGITAVNATGEFACALRTDTTVVCWGANDRGQLGTGTSNPRRLTPVVVYG